MLRVVVDPGVLVSAFISRHGSPPDQIVRAWHDGALDLLVSPTLLRELSEVLGRKKFSEYAANGRADAYVDSFLTDAIHFGDVESPPTVSADPYDDYLFALAVSASADFIISGDRHLLEVEGHDPPVLTPRQFVEQLLI